MISGDITVARLLDEHPELVEVLAGYHPHFQQLRDESLRRVMAPRVTLAQAARIAGVSPDDLLAMLRRAVGKQPGHRDSAAGGAAPAGRPGVAPSEAEGGRVVIDVRELEPPQPLVRVLEALEQLRPGDTLEVLHERRPMFLYPQLDERGFTHETDEPEPGLVRIVIRRAGPAR